MRDGTATKELISRTALELFVQKGVKETTIRDISSAAGVAEGTMYRHYQSKDELAWDLFASNITEFTNKLVELRQQHKTLKAQSAALINAFCNFFDEDPILFSYLLLTQFGHLKELDIDMPHHFHVVRDMISEGMAKGEIPMRDPALVASMIIGLVQQVAIYKISGRLGSERSAVSDTSLADYKSGNKVAGSMAEEANTLIKAGWQVMKMKP